MKVYIRNAGNKDVGSVIKQAATFYGRTLLPRSTDELKVYIYLTNELKYREMGVTEVVDFSLRPKHFNILLNKKLNGRRLFETLAHEMVHVKQYATNQMLDYLNHDGVRFNGKIHYMEEHEYWMMPWEIEAFGMSYGLYKSFMDYHELKPTDIRIKRGKIVAFRKLK